MQQPDFIVLGAHKAGTTSLHHYLKQHPEIYLPANKGQDLLWRTKCATPDEATPYLEQFTDALPSQKRGEVSSVYLHKGPEQAQRMQTLFPDLKIIAVLRDPIERAYAHAFWSRPYQPHEIPEIETLVSTSEKFLNPGRYTTHLQNYLQYFERSQLLVLTHDALRQDAAAFLRELYGFIGVTANFTPNMGEQYNVSALKVDNAARRLLKRGLAAPQSLKKWLPQGVRSRLRDYLTTQSNRPKPKISAELEQFLTDYYRAEVEGLRDLVGLDCTHWLRKHEAESVR